MENITSVEQINTLKGKKVTFYTISSFAMIQRIQGKIVSAQEASYAQYDYGIKIVFRPYRKRRDSVIRAYRHSPHPTGGRGKDLIIVPGWTNDLRDPDTPLHSTVNGIEVVQKTSLDYASFSNIKSRAKEISESLSFYT